MPRFNADTLPWKGRRAVRLTNSKIEVTVLLGGGHIADLRICGSPINALWEAPWPTIEPQHFNDREHAALYGERVVGRMLSGYSGHAVAVPYFGMPSEFDANRGLALHGEAASAEWRLINKSISENFASITLETELPLSSLHFRRTLRMELNSSVVTVTELLRNQSATSRELQWVEHAAFGEPLFTPNESSMILSADRGVTWPLGYEGRELLPDSQDFQWPKVGEYDLSAPFLESGTGFVVALRVDSSLSRGHILVHNRRLNRAAGYVFDSQRFPWIALWEENLARNYAPWNGRTRVRGVEFGTSPMPLGLDHALQKQRLFETPVFTTVDGGTEITTSYQMFVTETPEEWQGLREIRTRGNHLLLQSKAGTELLL